jgi:hypothetical protein
MLHELSLATKEEIEGIKTLYQQHGTFDVDFVEVVIAEIILRK